MYILLKMNYAKFVFLTYFFKRYRRKTLGYNGNFAIRPPLVKEGYIINAFMVFPPSWTRTVYLERTFKLYGNGRKMVFSSLHCSKFSGKYRVLYYALIDQLWGPYGKIFGQQFWSADRTMWGSYEKLRSEYFPVWTSQLVNKSFIV